MSRMPRNPFSRVSWARIHASRVAIGGAVVLLLVAVLLPIALTAASPTFFNRYHELSLNSDNLENSRHKGLACSRCHIDERGPVVHSLAVVGDFYAGLLTDQKTPRFVRFDSPPREACLSCHETAWSHDPKRTSRVPHRAHMRVSTEERECVTCHKWTAHDETYMVKHKDMPFSGVCVAYGCHVGTKQPEDCDSCHHALREDVDWRLEHSKVVAVAGANGCLETCHDAEQCRQCHTTGVRPTFDGLATETGLREIERLHVREDWPTTHGAEALKDQGACMQCHITDGECRSCHQHRPESHGSEKTWIGQHSKVSEVDDPRCLTCHKKEWCDECHEQFKEMR